MIRNKAPDKLYPKNWTHILNLNVCFVVQIKDNFAQPV